MVWIPYAEDDKQRFDELAALYLICRKRLQEINIDTKMVASPGSVAHRDEQTLLSHDPPGRSTRTKKSSSHLWCLHDA